MSSLSYFAHSEKGLREKNEDACLAMEKDGVYVFAVAEGMGGASDGPGAAEVAVNALRGGGVECRGSLVEIAESLLARADEALFVSQEENPGSDPPAVAMTIALVGPAGECLVSSPGQRKVFFMPHPPPGGTGAAPGEEPVLHDPEAGMHEAVLPPGFLILCSDGISQFVEDARIHGIVKERGDDLEDACRKLVYEAFQNGSNDNLTVVLVRQPGG
ncbi:MAG: Protein phosphatase 2C [Methanoregulaceae archaeon PtaB.Bin056]|nr:MAG: Protein phosphatase 2C [Methanoregulaceae archaeon PtaB.Bin056]